MARLRESFAAFLALTFTAIAVSSAPSASFGTVLVAHRAHVGTASASVGATVFTGDKLSTEHGGSLQIRAGAARLVLGESSSATIGDLNGTPAATLLDGTAIFSTAVANGIALRAATAVVRPQNDGPTVAQVWVVNSKELVVRSTRGTLTITVNSETQIIPEAMAYRVILDPEARLEQEVPRGAGTKDYGEPPLPGRNRRFYLVPIIMATGVATIWAVHEAWESPDKP